jgi:hypothetical protein
MPSEAPSVSPIPSASRLVRPKLDMFALWQDSATLTLKLADERATPLRRSGEFAPP